MVEKLRPFITASNLSFPSDYTVAMVLFRLSHGYSAKTITSRSSLDPYLISKTTNMVTRLLATKLYPEFIKISVSRRRLIETTQGFEELTSLSNIYGAIDESLIKVLGLKLDKNLMNSYKYKYGYDSVLLQISAGTSTQNLFDGMLMKGRYVVVEAIGLLKTRWKILQDLNVGLNHAPQTIVACCVLHNLCHIAIEPEPEIRKDPDETRAPTRVLESEKQFYYFGESLRQALADNLHQRLSSR
ncbi:hypothetical protein CRYUN_Cryun04dG0052400 [Craigia yunnanensis]